MKFLSDLSSTARAHSPRLLPRLVRSWLSYYTPSSGFSPLELEQIRVAITESLDPDLTARLRPWKDEPDVDLEPGEFDHRLRISILRAIFLGLRGAPAASIADLGCGTGHFVAAARFFGHQCVGYDLPYGRLSPKTANSYRMCVQAMHYDRRDLSIEPFTPMNLPGQFDLITAGLVCFNEYPSDGLWSRQEWEFFVKDAYRYLRPGGRLFLELNEHKQFGRLRWFDAQTRDYFQQIGDIRRNKVTLVLPADASRF